MRICYLIFFFSWLNTSYTTQNSSKYSPKQVVYSGNKKSTLTTRFQCENWSILTKTKKILLNLTQNWPAKWHCGSEWGWGRGKRKNNSRRGAMRWMGLGYALEWAWILHSSVALQLPILGKCCSFWSAQLLCGGIDSDMCAHSPCCAPWGARRRRDTQNLTQGQQRTI